MNRFDISSFTNKFLEVGLVTKSNFYVKFTPPARLIGGENTELKEIALLCGATSLPGKRLSTTELKPYGYGQTIKSPYDVLYDDVQFTFYVDANRAMAVQLFDEWLRLAVGENGSFPTTQMKVSYKKDYICDIKIYVVSPLAGGGEVENYTSTTEEDGMAIVECTLIDAFPIQVDAMDLDWGASDEFMKLAVTFAFRTVEYKFGKFNPVKTPKGTYSYEPVQYESVVKITSPQEAQTTGFYLDTLGKNNPRGGIVQSLQQLQIYKTQLNNLFNAKGVTQTTQALSPFLGNNRAAVDTINSLGEIITNTKFVKRNVSNILKFP